MALRFSPSPDGKVDDREDGQETVLRHVQKSELKGFDPVGDVQEADLAGRAPGHVEAADVEAGAAFGDGYEPDVDGAFGVVEDVDERPIHAGVAAAVPVHEAES